MDDKERRQIISAETQKIINLIIEYSPIYDERAEELANITNIERKAVKSIIVLFDLATRSSQLRENPTLAYMKDIIQLIKCCGRIKDHLRAVVLGEQKIIFRLVHICYKNLEYLKQLTDVLGEDLLLQMDRHHNIALTYLPWPYFTRAMKQYYNKEIYFALIKEWWMHVAARSKTFHEQEGEANLFEYFEWSVQEKLDIEQKPGRKVFEPHEANVWLLLAEKFPATGNKDAQIKKTRIMAPEKNVAKAESSDLATSFVKEIDQYAKLTKITMERILLLLRKISPHDVNEKIRQRILKMDINLKHYFFRNTNTPKWVLEIFVKDLVPGSKDFHSLSRSNKVTAAKIHPSKIFYFERLPNDIIYYIVGYLHYAQAVLLALTNKQIYRSIMHNQYLIKVFSKKMFTNVKISAPSQFRKKLRAREQKFTFERMDYANRLKSLELTIDSILYSCQTNYTTISWENFKTGNRASKSTDWYLQSNLAARLKNGLVYAVHGDTVSILEPNNYILNNIADCHSTLINAKNGYFLFTENLLLGCGYSMDLTTNQIQRCNWTDNLLVIIMKENDGIGYGIGSERSTIKIFDQRTNAAMQSVISVNDGAVQNIDVRDNQLYVVARHISEWDPRYLRRAVRQSSDPNLMYCEQWGYYRPAIDLTSMKVLGQQQRWDLANFTWKFDRNCSSARRVACNGQLCTLELNGNLHTYRTGCDSFLTSDFYV